MQIYRQKINEILLFVSEKSERANHAHNEETQSNGTFNMSKHFSHFPTKHVAHCLYLHQYEYMFAPICGFDREKRKKTNRYFIIVDISIALQNRSVLRFSFPVRDNVSVILHPCILQSLVTKCYLAFSLPFVFVSSFFLCPTEGT